MSLKLAIYAIPFGFGPVSKAVSIIRAIDTLMEVEWYLVGTGISYEFLERENIKAQLIDTAGFQDQSIIINRVAKMVDGAVVLMDNDWANGLANQIPVFFADSLGFMWRKSDFASYPNMANMKAYYVQDVFGAVAQMMQTGMRNIRPVSPILDLNQGDKVYGGRAIFHLGGLLNPFNPETTRSYLMGFKEILRGINQQDPLVLMSEAARQKFPDLLGDVETVSLPHGKALSAMANSKFMWSSPGLTTLLEASALQIPLAPLPPQNYSQALNTRNMNRFYGSNLHEIWNFLDEEYHEIIPDMDERDGVAKITELNGKKLCEPRFVERFSQLALDAMKTRACVPHDLSKAGNGADIIAKDVKDFFLTLK